MAFDLIVNSVVMRLFLLVDVVVIVIVDVVVIVIVYVVIIVLDVLV